MRRLANSARRRRSKQIRRVVSRGLTNTHSLSFDGTNDRASWAANSTIPGLTGNSSHAWSYWVKSSDFTISGSNYYSTLLYALNFYGAGVSTYIYGAIGGSTHATNAGKFVVTSVRGSATYLNYASDSSVDGVFNNNQWNHVVISVHDTGSARNVTVYINGSAIAGTNGTTNSDDISAIDFGDIALGSQTFNAGGDSFDEIELDEIALFNTRLSAANVTEIYNSGVPADETERTGLIGYWRLENNGNDSSTNSNNLTVTGATFTSDVPS
jgi:hypothetical protein